MDSKPNRPDPGNVVMAAKDSAPSVGEANDPSPSDAFDASSSRPSAPAKVQSAASVRIQDTMETNSRTARETELTVAVGELNSDKSKDPQFDELPYDPDSDKETDNRLSLQLKDVYLYGSSSGYTKDLKERKSRAKRLAIQSNMHTQIVEERLVQLEKDVQMLLRMPPEEVGEDEDILKPLPHKLSISFMTWPAFSAPVAVPESKLHRYKWLHGLEVDGTRKSVVEVLIEQPQLGRIPSWASRNESMPNTDPASYDLYCIRFRSPLMLKLLERITEQKVMIGPHKHQLVLLRPFKLLIAYADKILDFLQVLEDKFGGQSPILEQAKGSYRSNDNAVPKELGKTEARTGDNSKAKKDGDAEGSKEDLKAQTATPDALLHMHLLKGLLTKYLSHTLEIRRGVETGNAQRVSFADLWHVFRYGQEVRSPGSKQAQLYRVLKFTGGRENNRDRPEREPNRYRPVREPSPSLAGEKYKNSGYSKDAFVLECVYFVFDGTQFGPIVEAFIIRKFEGEKAITSLPVYPLTLDSNHISLRKDLLQRGERYAQLSNSQKAVAAHMQYKGFTLDKHPEQVESQIIIDFKATFLQAQELQPIIAPISLVEHDSQEIGLDRFKCAKCGTSGCCGNDIVFHDYEVDDYFENLHNQEDRHFLDAVENATDLKESQKVLFPCEVYGFALRSRSWATFNIDLVKDVEYADGWENLVVDRTVKETVLALVKNHARTPEQTNSLKGALSSVDLVRGKGKGLIILLHGEPGVGKTSTAECVADHTRRPLFPITCGDIGDNSASVEANLEKNFQLAHKWGCVLLLDEADVFLSRRNSSDLTRNAIVSVFLRTLEYYSGILFLTTNRVGNIDRAFKSRIHVALYYPKLSKDVTYEIWKRNIKRIKADFKKEGKTVVIEEKDILRYSKEHFKELKVAKLLNWNGRQIRNAFQTAIALAEYDSANKETLVLNRKHFEKVAIASKEFDQYLKDTQKGKDDAQLARDEKARFDEYGEYDLNSGIMEEGIPWTPKSLPTMFRKPMAVQRRNSFAATKRKAQREELVSEESEESTESDISEESENEFEGDDVAGGAGVRSGESVEVSSEEMEESAVSPAKLNTRSKSMAKLRKAQSTKGSLREGKATGKPKKKNRDKDTSSTQR